MCVNVMASQTIVVRQGMQSNRYAFATANLKPDQEHVYDQEPDRDPRMLVGIFTSRQVQTLSDGNLACMPVQHTQQQTALGGPQTQHCCCLAQFSDMAPVQCTCSHVA